MGINRFWMLHGRRQETGVHEDPKTEATLRAALAEPAAPGEDESYRRLMTVIADDLRLRQPVQHRNWAWIPTTSVAIAGMLLAVIAYDAGVRNGKDWALYSQKPPVVAPHQANSGNAPSIYVPPVKQNPAQPKIDVKEIPGSPPKDTNNAILAWLPLETLTKDQQEFVRQAGNKADKGDWEGAAKALEQMADVDPSADASINAIHMAAEIRTKRLSDVAGALSLYQRELKMCDDQLAATQDADRQTLLKQWRDRADLGVSLLNGAPTTQDQTAPQAPPQ